MRFISGFLVLSGMTLFSGLPRAGAGGNDVTVPATGAARELSRQLFFLQNTMALIPGPSRGLFQQCEVVQGDLIYLQQQLKRQVAREELQLNYDKMESKLQQLLGDIKGIEGWDAALRLVARRVQAADHDLQFALATGPGAQMNAGQLAYRQTLSLLTRSETFANMVRYVFAEQNVLAPWNAELKVLSQNIAELKSLQSAKAAPAEVKNQFLATDQAWAKLVTRLKALPQGQNILLQSDAAQVDQVFFRLSGILGVKERRAPLRDPLAF